MVNVEIYTTSVCSYCRQAKNLLDKKGVKYTEINLDQDPQQREEMLTRTAGKRTVPQIIINDHSVGGFKELWDLERQGELDKLLADS